MMAKGYLMEDMMFSRPETLHHGPLVCENHGRTQEHESLPTGREGPFSFKTRLKNKAYCKKANSDHV